jgi:hypothetical protein
MELGGMFLECLVCGDGEYWRYGGGIFVGVLRFGFGVWVERTV